MDAPGTPVVIPASLYVWVALGVLYGLLLPLMVFGPAKASRHTEHVGQVLRWALGVIWGLSILSILFGHGMQYTYQGFVWGEITAWVSILILWGIPLKIIQADGRMLTFAIGLVLLVAGNTAFMTTRVYDLLHPQRGMFTVTGLFLGHQRDNPEVNMSLKEAKYTKTPSAGVVAELERLGHWSKVSTKMYRPENLKMELISAPSSEYVFMPQDYDLTPQQRSSLQWQKVLNGSLLVLAPAVGLYLHVLHALERRPEGRHAGAPSGKASRPLTSDRQVERRKSRRRRKS